jgi:hypothetical protein
MMKLSAGKSAQALVLASAFVIVFLIAAQAKPSPYIEPRNALPDFHADITTLSFNEAAPLPAAKRAASRETVGIGSSAEERALFEAPVAETPAGRCTARSIVFAKITLASACY